MVTVHVENEVHDYDTWRAAFDKFEVFRAEQGVRSYRIARSVTEPNRVHVDLDLDTVEAATAFCAALRKVWATPQSQAQLVAYREPVILDVTADRTLSPA